MAGAGLLANGALDGEDELLPTAGEKDREGDNGQSYAAAHVASLVGGWGVRRVRGPRSDLRRFGHRYWYVLSG